ncbi:AlwI family type II restriction endonuclease [Gracilibacillus phocaeensis]|uniref:AlwI family type II restriction endonuclease n=1 Tax=Gracilibacillus phocaeensis TaxID=2042304 RepID=UPI00102F5231|nr:AlwI family type II restriction endonuclease [Gracilibacillus phocaeensis]
MKVKEKQVFNLYDTNGRRKDVINAYKIYTEILEQIYQESESEVWARYPEANTQFRFYELAIEHSPEIFKQHSNYDRFIEAMKDPEVKKTFEQTPVKDIKRDPKLKELYKLLDTHIEKRARHYSSNLVKIGLADEKRRISPIGKSWIHGKKLRRSQLEELLPIDDTNLIFFRQLLKLRVYTNEGDYYYSPMWMAIYLLLKYERIHQDLFITLVQMMSPYQPVDVQAFVEDFLEGAAQVAERNYIDNQHGEAWEDITEAPIPMSNALFTAHFSSGKSEQAIQVYWEFYQRLIAFNHERKAEQLDKLVELFSDPKKRAMINKAFGFGRNLFHFDKKKTSDVEVFLEQNQAVDILSNDRINEKLFLQFQASKRHDQIQEYGDVTQRVMRVTGLIRFKNQIVELAQRDVWQKVFDKIDIQSLIFRPSTERACEAYEQAIESSDFFHHRTLEEIVAYPSDQVEPTIQAIKQALQITEEEDIRNTLLTQTSRAFQKHIADHYPKEKILEILPLFSDRRNDAKIQKMVSESTDVPTIFEYIVGIAWYHISSEKFDLFSSLNLSMNADFEPETHAGGGSGDMVVDYGDRIVMLEVTLMNKQAQKRGEWEPVLRHATNLTIESAPKPVTTLFIADELDENTINIWRAVAMVPLQSSRQAGKFADSVTIMPLKNDELATMLAHDKHDQEFFHQIQQSFAALSQNFDKEWRAGIIHD